MRYQNVCLEGIGYTLPEEIVTSSELETRLEPLYDRLRLPAGRLELMTGIRERRFWPAGALPSEISIASGERAIAAAGIDRRTVGALVHGSVCRDYLEPATASGVHCGLGLASECMIYDVSNACLGILNGIVQVANMIELGQIEAGLVVGTEGSRQLVETTIEHLNADTSLTRESVKLAVASLTIGSASVAILLVDRKLTRTGNAITAATAHANTAHHQLCHSGRDESAVGGMRPLMQTDSERLMREGIATGAETFARFLDDTGWTAGEIHKTFCHQVGLAHRRLLLEALKLDPAADFTTVQWLGNTGAAALPVTLALGAERGHIAAGDHVALLGIGSGINSLMVAAEWQTSDIVLGDDRAADVRDATAASVLAGSSAAGD